MKSHFDFLSHAILGIVLILSLLTASATHAADISIICGEQTKIGKIDYRDRSTSAQRWSIEDNRVNHLDPANRHMNEGEFSKRVMADIDWTLLRFPNHQVALEMLIRYALAGGQMYEFSPPECYFKWGKEFVPNDVNVVLAEAYYYWRRNDLPHARDAYQAAVNVDSNSATAHYNLGLVYCELKDYPKAVDHAAIAYKLGYPLPGLRKKLKAAGYELPAIADAVDEPAGKLAAH